MRQASILLFLILLGLDATTAYAECTSGGRTFQTGDKTGGVTCQPDGTWK
jgi:hypothetical protein